MYEAFDAFLTTQTWHTKEAADEERFFCALRTIVHKHRFSPREMGKYMMEKQRGQLTEEAFADAVDHYVEMARALKGYIQAKC